MAFMLYLTGRGRIKFLLLAICLFTSITAKGQNSVNLRVMAANLNGDVQNYQPFALRIFQGLKPDVVCIQEFDYAGDTDADFRSMVDTAFGTNFVYFRENITASGAIPNGIISRYPIVASGSWTDTEVANRGFAWARIHLPGTNDLYVVSVHLLTSSASERGIESAELKTQMLSLFPTNAWMVLAGDFNCGSRTESPGMPTLETFLSDNPIPVDNLGNSDTSINRNHPHDYVMPSFSFTNHEVATVYPNHVYPTGLVFDSRVYSVNDLTNFAPVQQADSGLAQHMGVVKDFLLTGVTNTSSAAPAITTQPASQTIAPGSTLIVSVTATGTAPLTYQWMLNSAPISGATTNPFTLYNAQFTDSGTYSVLVTNSLGNVLSSNALINVTNVPPDITSQPLSLSIATSSNATFSVTANGTAPLTYQWMLNTLPISGATTNPFTIINAQLTNSGTYSVLVTNAGGSILSSNAVLTVTNIPVTITSQPQSQSVGLGAGASFSVSVTGTSPLAYQWLENGTNIPGATANSFTIGSVNTTDAGDYRVVVTNYAGSVTSTVATLTVNTGQALIIAQWNFNSPVPDGVSTTGTRLPSTGVGTNIYVGGTVAAGTGGSGEFASGTGSGDPAASDNTAWNTTTYPAVNANNKTAGVQFNVSTLGKQNIVVSWASQASNTGSKYGRLQYTTNGTIFTDFPTSIINAGGSFSARTNDLSAFPNVNNNTNFAFRIVSEFESTAINDANAQYVGANGTYGTGGTIRFDMVTVSGFALVTSVPPVINFQPISLSITTTSNATFSVTAIGTNPLGYQWRFNGTNISGATTNPFVLSNAQTTDSGNYSVIVSNVMGTILSSNALLTVTNVPPDFATQPQPLTILSGSSATFSVTPTGTAPFTYQWRYNDANISGATTNPFTLNNAQTTDSGNYAVVITGPGGDNLSSDALLTVTNLPSAAAALLSVSTTAGGQFQFSVTGTPGTSYIVQSSTNLVGSDWVPLVTNVSPFTFTNMAPPVEEQYFRAITGP